MKKIKPTDITDNFIEVIGKEWMLITAGNENKFNMMTASWGMAGFLWNKPVVFVFVRPERYTFEFMEESELFTLSFMGEEHKGVHKICGSKSGRDIDKVKATGLEPITSENGSILFKQSRLSLECKKLYTDMIKEENFLDNELFKKWYGSVHGNPHKIYVAEIVNAWVKE